MLRIRPSYTFILFVITLSGAFFVDIERRRYDTAAMATPQASAPAVTATLRPTREPSTPTTLPTPTPTRMLPTVTPTPQRREIVPRPPVPRERQEPTAAPPMAPPLTIVPWDDRQPIRDGANTGSGERQY